MAYRYWRLRVDSATIAAIGIAELEMRATLGGADQTTGKTATASQETAPHVASRAIDDDNATFWTTGITTFPQYLTIDFVTPVDVAQIAIRVRADGFREDPLDFALEWSHNGTLWEEYYTFPTQGAWSAGEQRVLDVTDPGDTAEIEATQLGGYAVGIYPTEEVEASQLGGYVTGAAETSNTVFLIKAHQLGGYALVRPNGDRRELRAWTFKQDDHEFYGLQLGAAGTLVYDVSTEQWCQWKSPERTLWRVEDVVDWEGFNLGGDTESGKIWKIDPEGRLDYGTTPITSKIVGYLTHRFRKHGQCHMAELAVSEGHPPSGFEDGSVGISLRTSTDDGQSFVNHGEVPGEGVSEDMTVRWYGLGLMKSPGMLFEITDSGYARRIDGLDIDTDDDG